MRFTQNNIQAIVIDVQERLFPLMHQYDELEQKIMTLLKGLHLLKVPMIVSEQYPKALGGTLPLFTSLIEDHKYGEKTHFSCSDEKLLHQHIVSNQKNQILLFGIEAHICVLQTAIDLVSKGYEVCVVLDAVGSRSENNKAIGIERMKQEGVFVSSVESILFELCRDSKNSVFKELSNLLK